MTPEARFTRTQLALIALIYALAGVAAFLPILRTGFTGDDWMFLSHAVPARSVTVCFEPLVGYFVRPLVMLTYYANYRWFGLDPLPFHLTVVAVHVLAAWLLALVALRITGSKRVAAAAGLIFVAFSGHSEPVGWVAGAADPWLAVILLTGLLLFAKGLEAARPARWLAASVLVLLSGYLAKESAAAGGPLVAAWGAAAALAANRGDARRVLIRTALVAVPLVGATGLYLVARNQIFGSALGGYNDLNADRSILLQQTVAFVLRSFFPASAVFFHAWARAAGLAIIAGATLLALLLVRRQPPALAGLLFLWAAVAITLGPVLPLTISLVSNTSERFVYVPTVFSSVLMAWTIFLACGRRHAAAAVAIALVVAVQYPAFARAHAERVAAADMLRTFMGDLIPLLRKEAPAGRQSRLYLLTIPDSLRGTIVVRSGFHPALAVLAPEMTDREWRVVFVASHHLATPGARTMVTAEGARRFQVELRGGQIVESVWPRSDDFDVTNWGRTGYVIEFRPSVWRRVIAYESGGRLQQLGGLHAASLDAMPFGALDVPAPGAPCSGPAVRFSGWALDDQPGTVVSIQRETAAGVWTEVATAERHAGARPDVAAMFSAYPAAGEAQWEYSLPCTSPASTDRVHLRVVVRDSAGQEVVLGERTMIFPDNRTRR